MSGKQRQTENQKLTQKAAAIQKQLLLEQGSNLKTWDSLVPLMIQWAKLGQAEPMEAFFQQIIKDDNIPHSNIQTALQRCRLHAWSNRLRLVPPNSDMAKEATEQAAQALQNMMDDDTTIVVDLSSDFATVVKNYLSLEPLDWNVIYKVWKQWQEQVVSSSAAATTAINALLTAKIIRTLANHHHSSWQTAIQYAQQAMEIGSSTIAQHTRVNGDSSSTDDDNHHLIRVYNAMLEVYSKILPPPSKQQQTNDDSLEERQQLVGEKTNEILQQLKDNHNVVVPNDQTYATAMYAYCKCAWLPQAWEIWDEWNDQINNNNHHLELDARCLQMLIQSSVRQADTNHDANDEDHSRLYYYYANRTTQVIYDMWALYDRGYPEFQPDRDLYTSVLRCWANPRLSTSSLLMDTNNMETINALVANLNERAMTLSSLQPDMALYKEWMAVVRGQFGGTTTTLAAKVAEQAGMIVKQMEVDPFVVPDTSVYNFLMDACLSDGSMVGVTRAEQTLTKMMENSSSNDNNGPNGRSFANIIRSWLAFDTAKAEQWLDRMEERFIPSKGLFQDVISRCCQESSNAHNNKKGEDARRQAERAHRLLNRMEELSKATDNPKLRPDKSLYDRVVEAWEALGAGDEIEKLRISQSEMYAEEAESTKKTTSQQHAIKSEDDVRKAMKQLGVSLDGNEKFQADTLTFNRIIRQLASAELPQGGQIAEEIFVYMLDQYLNHANVKLKPDIITFNTVILAHSKSKNPERCKRFLKNLQEL
ncbi:Pentatricopeptide repeat-containing protein (Partial), partial [Seminavis robusta]|eukprot:Sro624_g177430.1 Pentatricopeptide repeat-containing protein (759) ;mRNA; f:53741-56019